MLLFEADLLNSHLLFFNFPANLWVKPMWDIWWHMFSCFCFFYFIIIQLSTRMAYSPTPPPWVAHPINSLYMYEYHDLHTWQQNWSELLITCWFSICLFVLSADFSGCRKRPVSGGEDNVCDFFFPKLWVCRWMTHQVEELSIYIS